MSLLAWNCRGLGKTRTVQFLKDIAQQTKPSFIFLSETLANKDRIEVVRKAIGFTGCIAVDARGHSGGLALFWKNEGGCVVKEVNTHFIDFEVQNEQVGRWRFTGFYGCPERSRRTESWEILLNLAAKSELPWCVISDFNDLMFAAEKRGGRRHPYNLLTGFAETIYACNLVDLGFVGERFTWEKSRGTDKWVQEHLDRGFATQAWCILFPEAEIRVLDVTTSDHLPLHLQLNKRVYVPRGKRFKFENVWLKEKDCLNVVRDSWSSTAGREILDRINFCCLQLEQWGGGVTLEYKKKLAGYRGELRKLRARRDAHGIRLYNEAR